jgi:apolipoprotein N-acyltransferase
VASGITLVTGLPWLWTQIDKVRTFFFFFFGQFAPGLHWLTSCHGYDRAWFLWLSGFHGYGIAWFVNDDIAWFDWDHVGMDFIGLSL